MRKERGSIEVKKAAGVCSLLDSQPKQSVPPEEFLYICGCLISNTTASNPASLFSLLLGMVFVAIGVSSDLSVTSMLQIGMEPFEKTMGVAAGCMLLFLGGLMIYCALHSRMKRLRMMIQVDRVQIFSTRAEGIRCVSSYDMDVYRAKAEMLACTAYCDVEFTVLAPHLIKKDQGRCLLAGIRAGGNAYSTGYYMIPLYHPEDRWCSRMRRIGNKRVRKSGSISI